MQMLQKMAEDGSSTSSDAAANPGRGTVNATVSRVVVSVAGEAAEEGRRLTSSPTYVPVSTRHVHEFPSGHSCTLNSDAPMYLAVEGGSAVFYPGTPTETVGLFTVEPKDYIATATQTFTSPFKLVHDASCSAAPTLALGLSTTVNALAVASTFTLNGASVDATGTWVELPLKSGIVKLSWTDQTGDYTPQYMIKNGWVYMRGGVQKSDGSTMGWNTQISELPNAIIPKTFAAAIVAGSDGGGFVKLHIDAEGTTYAGFFGVVAAAGAFSTNVILNSIYYYML